MKICSRYNIVQSQFCFREKKIENKDVPQKQTHYAYAAGLGALAIGGAAVAYKTIPHRYIRDLAKDLSLEMNETIKPSSLKSVMSKSEFMHEVKKLGEQNYVASSENIKKGIFRADLHSHSKFSDGVLSVEEILNQAAEYGNKLHDINGKKFIFALSDHDGVEGVKEALKIIAKNPHKFKNIKFVPAAELSFPIECQYGSSKFKRYGNDVEMAEMLIYNINPFSKNTKDYFNELYRSRKQGVKQSIETANKKLAGYNFSEAEYNKFWAQKDGRYWEMNQHWGIYHYLNLKTRITDAAKASNKKPEVLFDEILTNFSKNKINKNGQNLDKYLNEYNLPLKGDSYDPRIIALKNDICPQQMGMLLYAPHESSFGRIAEFADKEDAILAFAHPGFTTQNMRPEVMLERMQYYVRNSRNLKCAERFHQAYPPENITPEEIKQCNEILDRLGLIDIGGRDNHSSNFTKFTV